MDVRPWCVLGVIAGAVLLPAPAAAQVGGPDASGNVFGPLPNFFFPLDGSSGITGANLNLGTGGRVDVVLPFSFPFYGGSYGVASVSANGALRFMPGAPTPGTNESIPSASVPAPDVAVYWDELDPSGGGAVRSFYDPIGGRVIISWEGVPRLGLLDGGFFQVQLYSDGALRLYYQDVDFGLPSVSSGESATVGMQDFVGATLGAGNALLIGSNSAFLPSGSAFYLGPCDGDADGDGYGSDACGGLDCDDFEFVVSPAALEVCGDGVDQDCDGIDVSSDADSDGYTAAACGGSDCNDSEPLINPGVDSDGDGVSVCADCDDGDASAFPGAVEACDGVDNDCDGIDDTLDVDLGPDADGDGALALCGDCDDGDALSYPGAPELCADGADNDCAAATPDVFDGDGDGAGCDLDCDDGAPSLFPGAVELLCSGLDEDCDAATLDLGDGDGDGASCAVDCDDADNYAYPGAPEFVCDGVDQACNGLGNEADADADGVTLCDDDCDDGDPTIYPGAPELCADGIDQDCDGTIDEALGGFYPLDDDDALTFPICSFSFPFCGDAFSSFTLHSNGRLTFGGAPLDGSDTDPTATGSLPDLLLEAPQIAFLWSDLDPTISGTVSVIEDAGAGTLEITFVNVTQSPSWPGALLGPNDVTVTLSSDGLATLDYGVVSGGVALVGWACSGGAASLDLSSPGLPSGATRLGQGTESGLYQRFLGLAAGGENVDLDNSSLAFCLTAGDDIDGDGWADLCGDCADGDPSTSPGATEQCDGVDHDCDGEASDLDADGDGFRPVPCGGADCDDSRADVNPGQTEQCDGVDNDCDGLPEVGSEDNDGDGWFVCGDDCDDGDAAVFPDAVELCNGVDDDCDGPVDEGFSRDADADGAASLVCGGDDCDDTDSDVLPGAEEVCDGVDNDCAGVIDDVDRDADGFADADCVGDDCNDLRAATFPGAPELCDGTDNDCNGVEDDVDVDGDGEIDVDCGGVDCDDADADVHSEAAEVCDDGADNDCDGALDRGNDTLPADPDCTACACGTSLLPRASEAPLVSLLCFPLLLLRRRRAA